MLNNTEAQPVRPARVVLIGAGGFIGGALLRRLSAEGVPVLALGRPGLDLLAPGSARLLVDAIHPEDTVVFASARAPVRDRAMLQQNLVMLDAVCSALEQRPPRHLVYLSSDAVYADSAEPMGEASCAEPASLHGAMHLTREIALRAAFPGSMAIVRPTLAYGHDDPHNGYGPNRFLRLAAKGEDIPLFGNGEERRDHVAVEDIAELMLQVILHRSEGIANAVTAEVASFMEIAEFAASLFPGPVRILTSPRVGPMPHRGYRAFLPSAGLAAFPSLRFRSWRDGLRAIATRRGQAS